MKEAVTPGTRTTKWTVDDYMRLPEGFPAGLIDGMLAKEPAATHRQKELVTRLLLRLEPVVGVDRVVPSPIDVLIDDENVLRPDLIVLPEGDPVRPGTGLVVLPIAVFQVLSPSTEDRDRNTKVGTCLRAGVHEVWPVDPGRKEIALRTIGEETTATGNEAIPSRTVPGFRLGPAGLFPA